MVDSILKSFEIWTDAQGVKSKGRVKNIDNISLEGINRLRKLILELAISGKLVSQNECDGHADELIGKAIEEKEKLISEGVIKKEKTLSPISNDKKLFNIPDNWQWVRLGIIGSTNIGLTYSPNDVANDGIIVLRSSNIQNGEIDLSDIVRVKKDIDEKVLVEQGDLLICARNGSKQLVGKCALIKKSVEPMAFGAFMAIYRSKFNDFIKIFIESPVYRRNLEGVSTTTINQITQDNLRNTVIPLPPFEEQKRIVDKVEELMALCDKLEEQKINNLKTHHYLVNCLLETLATATDDELQTAWERISQQFDTLFYTEDSIDQLKQAILQLAIMGKLVKQDSNDEPASVLIERINDEKQKLILEGIIKKDNKLPDVTEKEKPFSIPKKWEWVRLGEVTNYGFLTRIEPQDIDKETWVLELEDVEKGSSRLLQKPKAIEKKLGSTKNKFSKGDILYGKLRPYLDKVLIAEEGGVCSTEIIPFRGYLDILPEYLRLVLKSSYFISYATDSTHGMNLPRLGTEKARLALIPLPSRNEQMRIIKKVNHLFDLCNAISNKIVRAREVQNILSESIAATI